MAWLRRELKQVTGGILPATSAWAIDTNQRGLCLSTRGSANCHSLEPAFAHASRFWISGRQVPRGGSPMPPRLRPEIPRPSRPPTAPLPPLLAFSPRPNEPPSHGPPTYDSAGGKHMFRSFDVIRGPVPSARAAAKTGYRRRRKKMLSTSEGWPSSRGPEPRDGNDGPPWIE